MEKENKLKDPRNILEVENLNAFYNGKQYVYDVSLSLKRGQVLGLVGESGSGKSTIGKAIADIMKEYNGNIRIEDDSVQMIFQNTLDALNPKKKILWILEEPLKMMGVKNKEERLSKIASMLIKVNLDEELLCRYPDDLSGGQRQRVCIAIALLQESKLIIADEATSALDVTVQDNILSLMMNLKKEMGLSYLFISHDLEIISQISDEVIVLKNGRIVEKGTVENIYDNPKEEYTKKLLDACL